MDPPIPNNDVERERIDICENPTMMRVLGPGGPEAAMPCEVGITGRTRLTNCNVMVLFFSALLTNFVGGQKILDVLGIDCVVLRFHTIKSGV